MLETARFFHQFAALLNAGFSVQQSLGMAGKDCRPAFQRYLKEASVRVEAGEDLASALNSRLAPFDPWTIALIRAAEYSGALADTFERLAIAAETQHRRQKLYGSVMISTIVIGLGLLTLLLALIQRNTAFLLQPGFILLPLLAIAALLFNGRGITVAGDLGKTGHRLMAAVPVLKDIAQDRSMLYLAELELPLRCGIPILQALELIRARIPDPELAKSLTIAARQIQQGQTLSQSLQGKLPPMALQMMRTGEETGGLDDMLAKLAEYYESDLERRLKQLQTTLRPLAIVAAGGFVLLMGMQLISSLLNALPG